MKTIFPLLFLLLTLPCHARIGENLEQSVARYGSVVKDAPHGTIFKKGDFDIQVHFFNGQTDYLVIVKDPGAAVQDITSEELESLLLANFNDMKYSKHIEGNKLLFMSAFGAIAACYDPADKSLCVMSSEYMQRNREAKAARGETRPAATPASTSGF